MKDSLFEFTDYREFLKAWIAAQTPQWGVMTRLGKAAGCQRSYLSRVLAGAAHLTPAQGFRLALYLRLSSDERDYFLGLIEAERSGSGEYRAFLLEKNAAIKRSQVDLSKRSGRIATVESPITAEYYSTWYWAAIHILTSVPGFANVNAIAQRLNLPPKTVERVLTRLEKSGYVKREGACWKYAGHESHLPRNSPYVVSHHGNLRHQAVRDAADPAHEGLHFSVIQSIAKRDLAFFRARVLEVISEFSKMAGPSASEELVVFNCDYFVP